MGVEGRKPYYILGIISGIKLKQSLKNKFLSLVVVIIHCYSYLSFRKWKEDGSQGGSQV